MTKANSLFPFRQSIPEKYRKKSGQPVGKELHSIVPRRLSVGEAVVTGVFAPKSSACKIYPPPPEGALRVQLLCFRLPAMQCPGSSCRLPQNPCSRLPSNGVFQTFNLLFIAATKSTRVEVKFRFTNERERLPCAVKGKKISACWLRRKSSEAAANGVKSVRGVDYQQTSCKNGPETKK